MATIKNNDEIFEAMKQEKKALLAIGKVIELIKDSSYGKLDLAVHIDGWNALVLLAAGNTLFAHVIDYQDIDTVEKLQDDLRAGALDIFDNEFIVSSGFGRVVDGEGEAIKNYKPLKLILSGILTACRRNGLNFGPEVYSSF
jgi:hypothetical protein